MSDRSQRAIRALAEQCVLRAGEVVNGPTGLIAVFDADWPASHMSNRVVVTAELPDDVRAHDVLAFTDDAFAGRGLSHRKVDVLDDAVGQRLAAGLTSAGYEAAPVLLMAATTTPALGPGVIVVETVAEAEVSVLVDKGWRLEAVDFSDETVRQLVGRRIASDRAGSMTRLAVRDPATGILAAKADLLVSGSVAEIDDVLTLPDHRGRGYASALVLEAVTLAHAAGADLVFLEAAEDDWPQHLYLRLGFETVGRIHEFSKLGVEDKP